MRHLTLLIATAFLLVANLGSAGPAHATLPPPATVDLGLDVPLTDETSQLELPDFAHLRALDPWINDNDAPAEERPQLEIRLQASGFASQPTYGDPTLLLEVKRHPQTLENSWGLVLYQRDPDGRPQRGPTLLRGYAVQLPPPRDYKPAFFRLTGPGTDPLGYPCGGPRQVSARRLREYALNQGYWPKLVLTDTVGAAGGEWEYRLLTKGAAFMLIRADSAVDEAAAGSGCVYASGDGLELPDLDALTLLFQAIGQPVPDVAVPPVRVPDSRKAVRWGKVRWPPPILDQPVPPAARPRVGPPVMVRHAPPAQPGLPATTVSAPGM